MRVALKHRAFSQNVLQYMAVVRQCQAALKCRFKEGKQILCSPLCPCALDGDDPAHGEGMKGTKANGLSWGAADQCPVSADPTSVVSDMDSNGRFRAYWHQINRFRPISGPLSAFKTHLWR